MAVEHAETIVQLALTGLLSAPVIQTVFAKPTDEESKPSSEHHETQSQVSEATPAPEPEASESSPRNKTTTMTDPAPVVLAPPLPTTQDQARQLFVQNALHSGSFNTSTHEERVEIERPTEIQEPQTAASEHPNPLEQPTTTNNNEPEKMGLLSVLTGNIPADISSPAARDSSNGHGIISNDLQANTVGPTTKQGIVRSDTVKSHLTAGTEGTHDHRAEERAATPLADRSATPAPVSATSEHGPIAAATGDGYSPLPAAALHATGDVPRSSYDEKDGQVGREPLNDRADLPVREGVEAGVPASVGADGRYEAVRGEESLSRPP